MEEIVARAIARGRFERKRNNQSLSFLEKEQRMADLTDTYWRDFIPDAKLVIAAILKATEKGNQK